MHTHRKIWGIRGRIGHGGDLVARVHRASVGEDLGGYPEGIGEDRERVTQIRADAQGSAPVHIASSLHLPNFYLHDPKANSHLEFSIDLR